MRMSVTLAFAVGGLMAAAVLRADGTDSGAARFKVSGFDGDRLELDAGNLYSPVRVPVVRDDASRPATNIVVCGAYRETVIWGIGETQKLVMVQIPLDGAVGGNIPLSLEDPDGTELADTAITIMPDESGSPHEPWWIGEKSPGELPYGEWTFDYDAAQAKVAAEGGFVLAMFTGTLWCPHCASIGATLLSDPAFAEWGRSNRVVFVVFDQARLGKAAPRLLSYDPDPNRSGADAVSGAAYLTRKGVDPELAAAVIARTTAFSTKQWLPEDSTASRLSNPTMLFVGGDGTVAARVKLVRTAEGYPSDKNLARLDEALGSLNGPPPPSSIEDGPDPVPAVPLPRALHMKVPLYSGEDGATSMVAVLDFRMSRGERVSAKVVGERLRLSFKGILEGLPDGGAFAEMETGGGAALAVTLSADGRFAASLAGGGQLPDCRSDRVHANTGGLFGAAYAGYYTVALPPEDGLSGAATLRLTLTDGGLAKWKGRLPDGKSISGNCPFTIDGAGRAIVPVFYRSARRVASFPLMVRPWAASRATGENPVYRAVKLVSGVAGHLELGGRRREFKAWGSYYSPAYRFDACACLAYGTNTLRLVFETGAQTFPGLAFPEGRVVVGDSSVVLSGEQRGLSLSFQKKTGVLRGTMTFSRGRMRRTATYHGVLIPGWHDCGCTPADLNPSTPFYIENAYPNADPFALGSACFKRRGEAGTESHSILVKID